MADDPELPDLPAMVTDLTPLTRIRVETSLSRFPIHRLAKRGSVEIDIQNSETGVKWRVTYNAGFGEPGPLAYKLDTLVINRRLDEAPRPLPDIIRIGSLSEIARELGMSAGKSLQDIKRAFYQNAFAAIVAHVRVKTKSGKERWQEIGWSRYSVAFTGEELPDGRVADAVYIIPNAVYKSILDEAEVRPLDYDYLRELLPGPQRFYELLSFQMYGAIASGRPRAKLLYGAYCTVAPQARYADREQARKQMYKLHTPHLESGYIVDATFEPAPDSEGQPDWAMLYTPGPRARAEFDAFNRRADGRGDQRTLLPASTAVTIAPATATPGTTATTASEQEGLPFGDAPADPELVALLVERGIDARTAATLLAATVPGQDVRRQIAYADERIAHDKRIDSPTGYLVDMLRRNRPVPRTFQPSRAAGPTAGAAEHGRIAALERQYLAARSAAYERVLADLPEHEQLLETERAAARAEYATAPVSPEVIERIARGSLLRRMEADGRFTFPAIDVWSASSRAER